MLYILQNPGQSRRFGDAVRKLGLFRCWSTDELTSNAQVEGAVYPRVGPCRTSSCSCAAGHFSEETQNAEIDAAQTRVEKSLADMLSSR